MMVLWPRSAQMAPGLTTADTSAVQDQTSFSVVLLLMPVDVLTSLV